MGYDCLLCERCFPDKSFTEKHHLTPKSRGGKITVRLCSDCADQIHILFTNKELEKKFNSIEALKSDPRIQTWLKWIQKRKNFHSICVKTKKRKLK